MENPLFEESYKRLFGPSVGIGPAGDSFFARFYDKFLQEPAVARLFARTDMHRQVGMLRRSLFHLVSYYVTDTATSELERIAELHHRLGIPTDLYDHFVDCLAATVADMDAEADLLTEYAWRLALAPGITYIKLWAEFHHQQRL